MTLIPADKGHAAPFGVYTISPDSWGKTAKAIRFLGCSFPCSGNGILATCSHVVQGISPDEMLVVQHVTEPNCHKASVIAHHNKIDIAFLRIDTKTPLWPSPILEELSLGSNVFAYGYYDTSIEDGIITVIPQLFSGTITATPRKNFGLPTATPFYQVSFPALPGFSGSPLFAEYGEGFALCGMLFENRSSKIVVRTIDEYKDNELHFVEKSVREWESGIAHTAMTIIASASDLGVSIWK